MIKHIVTGTALGALMAFALIPMESGAQMRIITHTHAPAQASGGPVNDGLDNDSDGTAAAAVPGIDTDSNGMGNDTAYEISPGNRMVTSLAAPGTNQAADDTPPPSGRRQHGFYSITHELGQAAPESGTDEATPARTRQSRPRARVRPRG